MSGSGRTRANARKIGVLISESEPSVVGPLEQGVRAALKEAGILENSLEVRTVPGNFELPLVAWNMARRQQLVVLIVIACMPTKGDITVDSGDSVMKGLMEVQLKSGVPVVGGVITIKWATAKDLENQGKEWAKAALVLGDNNFTPLSYSGM